MKKIKVLFLLLLFGFSCAVSAVAQNELLVEDPKLYFDQNVSTVTLVLKDDSRLQVNLIYNDGSSVYYKTSASPDVVRTSLTRVSSIIYADGSIEPIYNGSTLAGTTAAVSLPAMVLPGAAAATTPAAVIAETTTETAAVTAQNQPVAPAQNQQMQSGEVRLVFEPIQGRNGDFIDIMIDGEYGGTIDVDHGAVVVTEAGAKDIKLNYAGNENDGTGTHLTANGNTTYTVKLPNRVRGFFKSNLGKMNPRVSDQQGLQVNQPSNYREIRLGVYPEWNNQLFPFNHSMLYMSTLPDLYHMPDDGYLGGASFKFGQAIDFPINSGSLHFGFFYNFSITDSYRITTVSEYDYWYGDFIETTSTEESIFLTYSVGPTFTYYLLNGKHFVPFAGVELPFRMSGFEGSGEITTDVNLNLKAGSHFYFSKSFGISSHYVVDMAGNSNFHYGFTFRLIPKKRAEHRGTYWYNR